MTSFKVFVEWCIHCARSVVRTVPSDPYACMPTVPIEDNVATASGTNNVECRVIKWQFSPRTCTIRDSTCHSKHAHVPTLFGWETEQASHFLFASTLQWGIILAKGTNCGHCLLQSKRASMTTCINGLDKIKSGYITPTSSGGQEWAELLHNPRALGGPQQRGQNQKWLHHACLLRSPKMGGKATQPRRSMPFSQLQKHVIGRSGRENLHLLSWALNKMLQSHCARLSQKIPHRDMLPNGWRWDSNR